MNEQRRASLKTSTPYLILIGLGLILLGIAGILWLPARTSAVNLRDELSIRPAAVNYAAPELTLTDLTGAEVSLAGMQGQVVLVNLWATWCPPCKEEMPTLQAYYDDHKAEGFVIAAINDGDPRQDVIEFVEDYRLTFPVWLDPTYSATERAFNALNLPSSFVIDRQGVVRLRWVGAVTTKTLEEYVTPLIME